jgi:hypothetical protein
MTTLVLNIETIPTARALEIPYPQDREAPAHYRDPEKIAAWHVRDRETWHVERVKTYSLSPLWGRVVLVGVYPDTGGLMCQRAPQASDEPAVIAWAFAHMTSAERVVTFNGMRFDLPFLRARAVLLGVPWPGSVPFGDYLHRFETRPHCDMYAVLNNGDRHAHGTLDEWGQAVGYMPKLQSGAGVWDAYCRDDWAYIEAECMANLERTRTLYAHLTAFGR